jgi:signal transduction histidine kinase
MIERFRFYQLARFGLMLTNLAAVVFVAWIKMSTTELVCLNDDARMLLERLRAVPARPGYAMGLSVSLYLALIASVLLREAFGKGLPFLLTLGLSLLDLAICIAVPLLLDFRLKYILLIVIANGIAYLPDKVWKSGFTALIVLLYIAPDFRLISEGISTLSIDEFIQYHPAAERASLLGIRDVLVSIAEVFFIAYLVLELQNALTESFRIRRLNRELTESRDELAVANAQLQIYSERAEDTARIKERNRLAREIHDTVGHCLTGLSLGLAATRELFRRSPERVEDQIGRLESLSSQGLDDIRRSLKQLRPDGLESRDLSSALQKLAGEINGCSNRRIELRISGDIDELNPSLEETVYHVVQEGITNAVRHGNANNISVDLASSESILSIDVSDDGIGCAEVFEGFGLNSMRERVADNDGMLEIESFPGRGFSLSVKVPLAGGAAR